MTIEDSPDVEQEVYPTEEVDSPIFSPASVDEIVDKDITDKTRAIIDKIASATQNSELTTTSEEQEAISLEEFTKQFNIEHVVDFEGQPIKYTKVEPTNNALLSPKWVVFVGGFSSTKERYYDELINLAQNGRKVLFVNPAVPAHANDEEKDPILAKIPLIIRTEKDALKMILDEEGIRGCDMVAHSRGGAIATTLLAEDPSYAERALLDSPAGLIGHDSALRLFGRAILEEVVHRAQVIMKQELPPDKIELRGKKAYKDNLVKKFMWHLTKEIPAIAGTDIKPLLERIRAGNEDPEKPQVEMILLNAHGDHIFTPERIENTLDNEPLKFFGRWVNYAGRKDGHGKLNRPASGIYPAILPNDATQKRHSLIKSILVDEHKKPSLGTSSPNV